MMRIISWNVNGLRRNVDNVAQLLEQADILCLQETRHHDALSLLSSKFPSHDHFVNVGLVKGYSGVSISVRKGITCEHVPVNFHPLVESEGRAVTVMIDNKFHVVSLYSPNSGRELARLPIRVE